MFITNMEDKGMDMRRLFKSNTNRVFCGVCGGIGDYFGIDATVVRLIWALFCFAGGGGVLAYVIAAIIIPSEM